jgi:hypothetical protein
MARIHFDDGLNEFEVDIQEDFSNKKLQVKVTFIDEGKEDVYEGELNRRPVVS